MSKYLIKNITPKVLATFNTRYEIKSSGCWEWNLYKDRDGYGQIRFKSDPDGRANVGRAHRVSWMIANNLDWPEDKPVARHTCNNPSCVNPTHIIPGTPKENQEDMDRAGRRVNGQQPNTKEIMTPYGLFPSLAECARELKIHITTVQRKMKNKPQEYYHVKR